MVASFWWSRQLALSFRFLLGAHCGQDVKNAPFVFGVTADLLRGGRCVVVSAWWSVRSVARGADCEAKSEQAARESGNQESGSEEMRNQGVG